jgi:hypothetical protein
MDIVEQLRKQNLGGIFSDYYVSYAEAADEIERLQKVIINMTNMSNDIWNAGAIALWEDE